MRFSKNSGYKINMQNYVVFLSLYSGEHFVVPMFLSKYKQKRNNLCFKNKAE